MGFVMGGGSHRLRLGEAPLHSWVNPTSNEIAICRTHSHSQWRCNDGVTERGKTRQPKHSGRFYELLFGARSAAGSMTALSLALNVRGHRFQMHHYRDCAGDPLKN